MAKPTPDDAPKRNLGYSQRALVLDRFEAEADQGDGVAEHGDALAVSLGPEV